MSSSQISTNFGQFNLKNFEVKSGETIRKKEWVIFFIFFFLIPILWVAIRSIIYPDYSSYFYSGFSSSALVIYYLSIFLFQIGIPLIGAITLSFMMKKRFISSNLLYFSLIIPCRYILSLIVSNFSSNIENLSSFIVDFLYAIIVIIFFICKNDRFKKMFEISFSKKNVWVTIFYIAVFFGLAYLIQYLFTLISSSISYTSISDNQASLISNTNTFFGFFSIFCISVIAAPLVEEICFRFIFQDTFNNKWYGYLLTIIYFAFLHIQNAGDWSWIFPYFSLGIVNGFIYYKFKNITIPIFVHFLINLLSFILIFTN